jgi:23S rRNA (guanine2445-N2)-methyltransferase / 23S rRNA (guanine2069-N7)-methyltransferase
MSNTYLEWAAKNFAANGIAEGPQHELVRADCTVWIPAGGSSRRRWDVIFLDPPTFSTSKKMEGTFDVQRDHVGLVRSTAKLLEKNGVLLFSNNLRRFKLDAGAMPELTFEDITRRTIPEDFRQQDDAHHAWLVRAKE